MRWGICEEPVAHDMWRYKNGLEERGKTGLGPWRKAVILHEGHGSK